MRGFAGGLGVRCQYCHVHEGNQPNNLSTFDFASDELQFNAQSQGRDPALVAIYEAQIGEPATTDQHGQAVAVVAAGVKNDSGTHGVAFDAEILAVDFFSGVNETLVVQNGITFHVSDPWTYLTDNGDAGTEGREK